MLKRLLAAACILLAGSAAYAQVVPPQQGSILYRDAAGWKYLTPGTSGQSLVSGGPGANPAWSSSAGGGSGGTSAVVVGDSGSGGTAGLVPAPAAGDAAAGKFLGANGLFATPTAAGILSQAMPTTTATGSGVTAGLVPVSDYSAVQAASDDVFGNAMFHFYDYSADRVLPVTTGYVDTSASYTNGNDWQIAQFMSLLHARCTGLEDQVACSRFRSAWTNIVGIQGTGTTGHGLGSADPYPSGNVGFSDDAVWIIGMECQAYELAPSLTTLNNMMSLFPAVLTRFKDPNQSVVALPGSNGELQPSPNGLLYDAGTGDGHDKRSSIYEAGLAANAVKIYQWSHHGDYLQYAIFYENMARTYFRHNATFYDGAADTTHSIGLYGGEIDLNPYAHAGDGNGGEANITPLTANPWLFKTTQPGYGPPRRGNAREADYGTLMMGVLEARLYRQTGLSKYLQEAKNIVAAYAASDGFMRVNATAGGVTGNMFISARDSWTNFYWLPAFVREVLTLPGVDPSGTFKNALMNTAVAIAGEKTSDGYYSGDFTGPESQNSDGSGYTNYADQGRCINSAKGPCLDSQGRGTDLSEPQQIMTTSQAALMATSAAMVQRMQRTIH